MGHIYNIPQEFPPGWQGQEGDIYAAGSTFQYSTVFAPGTVFEGNIYFKGGCDQPLCDPYIHVAGDTVIGENSIFQYVQFLNGKTVVIGRPLIDGGDNEWNGADQEYKGETIGESVSAVTDCCSQSISSQGEVDPIKLFCNGCPLIDRDVSL